MTYTYMAARQLLGMRERPLDPPEGIAVRYRKRFRDRDVASQWSCIREWMQAHGHGAEVMAEAHQFHRHSGAIMAARFAGDHDIANRLTEEAQREYLGELIQREWDAQS